MPNREDIQKFLDTEQSKVQKAYRYDRDVKYLLQELYSERNRHATCEEEMLFANPAQVDKVLKLELMNSIIDKVSKHYNRNPFNDYIEERAKFREYLSMLIEDNNSEKRLLGEILTLVGDYYNRPAAC